MIVVQAIIETLDEETDPIEAKVEEALAILEEHSLEHGSEILDDTEEGFDEVVEQLDVTIPDTPAPTPPPTPTICTGNETYDETLENAIFVDNFGPGFELVKVIKGRGQPEDNEHGSATDYWDSSYNGSEIYHKEGDIVRLGCKLGYWNNIGKSYTGATCTCQNGTCAFVKSRMEFDCIDEAVAPMPIWQGGVFNFIREVHDTYIVMKARAINLMQAQNWTDNRIDWERNPEYLEPQFWKGANYTFFVFCPWDVTLGGINPGEGQMTFPDFYPSENSDDGMLWSFLSRPGNHLFKYGQPFKSRYFKGFVDRSPNATEWGPTVFTTDMVTGQDYTCETGILPGHHPTAIQDLMDNFDIFFGGDFTKMTNYLRGANNRVVKQLKKKLSKLKAYGQVRG